MQPFHPYIEVGGDHAKDSSLKKVLQALYPEEVIHWNAESDLKNVDTYVLFYLCAYGAEELSLLKKGIEYARQLLESNQLKQKAHLLMIFYRDLKVAFPERKLQREKVMSEMMTEKVFHCESSIFQERVQVTHEFGTNHLQDTLEKLTGSHLYFEIMA